MKEINLYYACRRTRNFGDLLSINISKELFGVKCNYAEPVDCEAMFIGSIFEKIIYPYRTKFHKLYHAKEKESIKVWGSGFCAKQKKKKEQFYREIEVYAVRGLLTRNRLEKLLQKDLKEVVIGDPGLFAADLIKNEKIEKKFKVGIIPHYIDKNEETLKNIQLEDAVVLDVCEDGKECIRNIAKCEVIISSSLHGLIVADSLGIPNARIILSDKIDGGDYKYNDYYSVYGMEEHMKYDLRNEIIDENIIKAIKENYSINQEKVQEIKNNLMEVFPYQN